MKKLKKKSQTHPPLTSGDVKRIRESLGLNQLQAGELLGGGPRAFQKYESGIVSPSATTMNLLRLLDADPTALGTLTGSATPIQQTGIRPFEITGAHISALGDRFLVALVRRLLSAETSKNGIPPDHIHVASNITAADGGEDARVTWSGGPKRTNYLPSRDCLIQIKAAAISPARAAKDVLTTVGDVEPAIRDVLESGGYYLMLCNRSYTRKAVMDRQAAVIAAIQSKATKFKAGQVAFRDADQIASWVNEHPHVATWVLEQTQPGMATTLHTWSHWAGRHEYRHSFVPDERLAKIRESVRVAVDREREVVRIVGLSGLGKSRLVLEALIDDDSAVSASDIVLYGVETEIGSPQVKGAVQRLADLGQRAVIVIDRCSEETHTDLAAMVRRSNSKLSLITIDHEVPPGPPHPGTVLLERAIDKVVEEVVRGISPGLAPEDVRRLVSFAAGFPQMAVLASEVWASGANLTGVTKDYLVDKVVVGRHATSPSRLLQTAKLLSVFGMVGFREEFEEELDQIAQLASDLNTTELRVGINDLLRRRILQPRGRFATLQPRPIAHSLAERQWQEWSKAQWELTLVRLPSELRERASRQLAQLNRTEIAHEVTRYVCRPGGCFDSFEALSDAGNSGVVDNLSQVDATAVGNLITRVLDTVSVEELRLLSGRARADIRWAAQRIAFPKDTFELGARLLLKLALAENETWSNNCTGQFKALFPSYLGNTEANGRTRLLFLDELIARKEPELNKLVVGALQSGSELRQFSRAVGIESHGLRPTLHPWNPSDADAVEYIKECLKRLTVFAMLDDEWGDLARKTLAINLRTLVVHGFLEFVEEAVDAITSRYGAYWPAALESLGDVITYDLAGMPPEVEQKVRALIFKVTPSNLPERLKLLVTEMPWDYPCDVKLEFQERETRQREAIYEVAAEALRSPSILMQTLPSLCAGQQRMSSLFGLALAELAENKLDLLWDILHVYRNASHDTWNVDLITSYLAELARAHPRLVETFKRRAMRSKTLAWWVPILSFKMGIPASDILLVTQGLKEGTLAVRYLNSWTFGGHLAKRAPEEVAPLFEQLLSDGEQVNIGCDLLGMYVHENRTRLEKFRPQIRLAAEKAFSSRPNAMSDHHFSEIMGWMLNHGRDDADARSVALILARQLADRANSGPLSDEQRMRPLLPLLLRNFPEVVWPLIGSAITSSPKTAWHFQHLLGKGFSFAQGAGDAPILELSEDTLLAWCHANPEVAPAFLAGLLPPLSGKSFHPTLLRVIDSYGDQPAVQSALSANMNTFGWTGSIANYYELYQKPLSDLHSHERPAVRHWARKMSTEIERKIAYARKEDDERDAQYE